MARLLTHHTPLTVLLAIWLTAGASAGEAKSVDGTANPPLLYEQDMPELQPQREFNDSLPAMNTDDSDDQSNRWRPWRRKTRTKRAAPTDAPDEKPIPASLADALPNSAEEKPADSPANNGIDSAANDTAGDAAVPAASQMTDTPDAGMDTAEAMHWRDEYRQPATPQSVLDYQLKLEARLLERYNNLPEYGGMIGRVAIVLSKPLETSMDGSMIRAEFDQLVYDHWGKRLPALEKEYYVVTFGAGGVHQVRTDPSIRVGLDMEKTFSERAPLPADPFRAIEDAEAFRPTPTMDMPEWWRPDMDYR